jgi:IS1 family transposase/transposase-like protein
VPLYSKNSLFNTISLQQLPCVWEKNAGLFFQSLLRFLNVKISILTTRHQLMTAIPDNIYCHNENCSEHGVSGGDNIRIRRIYGINHDRIMYYCKACKHEFAATTNTPMFRSHLPLDKVAEICDLSAKGTNISSIAEKVGSSKAAVIRHIRLAGQHAAAVSESLIKDLQLTEVQLDEMWSFVLRKKHLDLPDFMLGHGEVWTWTAVDTKTRMVIAYVVGRHTLEEAREIVQRIKDIHSGGTPPLYVSDELAHYKTVLIELYSSSVPVPPTGKRGRPSNPQLVIDPELHYATVLKRRKGGKILSVTRTVEFGTLEGVNARLENSPSKTINTSYVERINLDLREWDSNLSRKSMAFAKDIVSFEAKVALTLFRYNFMKAHRSLSKPIKHGGRKTTPAMAAGIADRLWSMKELLQMPHPVGTHDMKLAA